jgi:hypothetical protein
MITDRLFDLLDDWRRLPAYQLERRADIFFALHMEEIIRARSHCKCTYSPNLPDKSTHSGYQVWQPY